MKSRSSECVGSVVLAAKGYGGSVAVLCVLFLGLSFHAFSQEATILGTVTDPSGSVVPGVKISVTHVETNEERGVVTNDTGQYVAADLPIGHYNVIVRAVGSADRWIRAPGTRSPPSPRTMCQRPALPPEGSPCCHAGRDRQRFNDGERGNGFCRRGAAHGCHRSSHLAFGRSVGGRSSRVASGNRIGVARLVFQFHKTPALQRCLIVVSAFG